MRKKDAALLISTSRGDAFTKKPGCVGVNEDGRKKNDGVEERGGLEGGKNRRGEAPRLSRDGAVKCQERKGKAAMAPT